MRLPSSARAATAVGALLVTIGSLSACSEIASLKQVGGNTAAAVSFAATDVLMAKKIAIMTAPTCTQGATTTECTGETAAGEKISVMAQNDVALTMTVDVGAKNVFTGSGQSVLDKAAEGK